MFVCVRWSLSAVSCKCHAGGKYSCWTTSSKKKLPPRYFTKRKPPSQEKYSIQSFPFPKMPMLKSTKGFRLVRWSVNGEERFVSKSSRGRGGRAFRDEDGFQFSFFRGIFLGGFDSSTGANLGQAFCRNFYFILPAKEISGFFIGMKISSLFIWYFHEGGVGF